MEALQLEIKPMKINNITVIIKKIMSCFLIFIIETIEEKETKVCN